DGTTAQVFGEVGYGFTFGRVALEPFAGLAWVSVNTDGFTEAGGAAALTGFGDSFDTGYSKLGLRAPTTLPPANGLGLIPPAAPRRLRAATLPRRRSGRDAGVPQHRRRLRGRRRAHRARQRPGGSRARSRRHGQGCARRVLCRPARRRRAGPRRQGQGGVAVL